MRQRGIANKVARLKLHDEESQECSFRGNETKFDLLYESNFRGTACNVRQWSEGRDFNGVAFNAGMPSALEVSWKERVRVLHSNRRDLASSIAASHDLLCRRMLW